MNKRVLKICVVEWDNASRDRRELAACRELGLEPLAMIRGEMGDRFREDMVDGFPVMRFDPRPIGANMPRLIRQACSILSWAWFARKLEPAVISGHDIEALAIGWLSTIGLPKSRKPKLVYDSHEFELGRNLKRSKWKLLAVKYLERFLMKRCAFSIMVNDAIADEVQSIHGLKERPIVVRSTPNKWSVDPDVCREIRKGFLEAMEDPREMLLMYHGGVMRGRGIETLLQITKENPNVCAVVLGNCRDHYLDELKDLTRELGVAGRVVFHPAVPINVLWKYVGAADVGMILAPATVKNHLYSLPNKFFENIQSETPVICPEYPAMKPIVDQYQFGLTCDPTDLSQVNACVEKMRTDKAFYAQCKENLKKAKEELCWEKEKTVLLEAYREALHL